MGSYLGSCSGCSIDDGADMLKCTKCTKTCGAQIESSIAFSSCGSSAFGNNGGKLVCEDLPPGPYLRSCNNCNKGEDGNLSCVCTGGGNPLALPLASWGSEPKAPFPKTFLCAICVQKVLSGAECRCCC
eukprot:Tamp_28521.p1 GENE.Tamp_28521~~Tamp_28521.p1  ORF type:complete len:129 (+),score=3.73 Tamp_28521:127-513(+)